MKTLSCTTAALGACALVLAGCGSGSETSESGLTPVSVGVIPIVDVASIYLGVDEGFFEAEGLEVELVQAQGGAAIVPAITSGEMDFGFSNVTSLIIAKSRGLPLRILTAGSATTGDADADFASVMAPEDAGIAAIEDLSGQRIAVNTLNNISDSTISEAVEQAGGDPASIDFVEMPFPDMPAALENGIVDAVAAVEPFQTILRGQGASSVFSNYAFPVEDLSVATYFTSEAIVQGKQEETEAFSRAMEQSQRFAEENPERVRDIIPTYTSVEPEIAQELTLPSFPDSVNAASLEQIVEISLKNDLIDEAPALDELLPGQ